MLITFISSDEGFDILCNYKKQFGCAVYILEPGSELILDTGPEAYVIDYSMPEEEFKEIVSQSIKTGENLLLQRFLHAKLEDDHDPNVVY